MARNSVYIYRSAGGHRPLAARYQNGVATDDSTTRPLGPALEPHANVADSPPEQAQPEENSCNDSAGRPRKQRSATQRGERTHLHNHTNTKATIQRQEYEPMLTQSSSEAETGPAP